MVKSDADIPDLKEREEALDPSRSFIVQAPAGSGKTDLLIRRFLTLLSAVERPEQVVAITFTRKAAGEMHRRIIDALEKASDSPPPDLPHERSAYDLAKGVLMRNVERGWCLLENPSRLKVQTIDSLCSSLTRQMPLLSGLGRQPAVTEKPEELYRVAARRTIAMAEKTGRDGEAVRQALRHLDNSFSSLEKHIIVMLANREQWLRHVNLKKGVDDDVLKGYLERSIQRVIEDSLGKVIASLPVGLTDDLMLYGSYAASNLIDGDEKRSAIRNLHSLTSPPGARYEEIHLWRGIRELLLTDKNDWRKSGGVSARTGFPADKSGEAAAMKEGFKELLDSLTGNERLREGLSSIKDLPDGSYDEMEWAILDDLLHLLPMTEGELMKLFAEKGTVDFQAVSMAAIASFGTDEAPTDLMLALDLTIQHILVDEYQDTSRSQLLLLEALTRGWEEGDGRTLFIVGDPMQSIYLFREAEVGLFLQAKEEGIGSVPLHPLTLRSNFRSQEGIIEWINWAFENAFPEKEDRFLGAIRYEHFCPLLAPLEDEAVRIRIFDHRADETEAKEIAETIRSIRGEQPDDTIAILARSRPHLGSIVQALKGEGIDFKTTDLDPLIERPVIQDLFALLRALMHPCDRTAWMAIMRAPWCGMTLADIHMLVVEERKRTVWELINDSSRVQPISGDGQKRLLKLKGKLEAALQLWGRVAPRRILEGLWIDLGGPACVNKDSIADADAFFEMVESESDAGTVESLQSLEARIKELYADHGGKERNPVELLTIHRAKGLEYDHVIIPGLGKSTRQQEKRLLLSMERVQGLLLAPIEGKEIEGESPIYRYLSILQSKKELLEQVRLFYVAATRARKRLYLYGHTKGMDDNDKPKVDGRSFLSSIPNIVELEDTVEAVPDVGGADAEETKKVIRLKRLPPGWEIPAPPHSVHVEMKESISPIPKEGPEFIWAGEAIKHLGTVIHRYLCRIAEDGIGSWPGERVKEELPVIASFLRQLGLNMEKAKSIASEGGSILQMALSDNRGRWILGRHEEEGVELPLSALKDGGVVHRIIDRTFVDEDGTRWVIDYKISRHEGSDINRFLERERERYKAQLEEYEEIMKAGGEKRVIRKALYYPAQSGWIEW